VIRAQGPSRVALMIRLVQGTRFGPVRKVANWQLRGHHGGLPYSRLRLGLWR
jgi:hypothetical protein